jgi:hypothetical protein
MIHRLIEVGRCYGMEMNVEKMRISRHTSPVQIMIREKQLVNVEYFCCLGSMVTNDEVCAREIRSRITMAKAAFNKKKTKKNLFTSKLDYITEETSGMLHL